MIILGLVVKEVPKLATLWSTEKARILKSGFLATGTPVGCRFGRLAARALRAS